MKIGLEVEGRHKGLSTFFVSTNELYEFTNRQEEFMLKYPKCRHLYISKESFVDILLLDEQTEPFSIYRVSLYCLIF